MKGIVYILIFAVASAAQAQRLLPDQQREQQREQRKHLSPKTEMALRKLTLAEMALTSIYIDTLDENKLTDAAIKGMLSELDPHTTYTTAEETKKLNEPLNSNFEGIGVQFNILRDTLVVIQTIPKGPSEKVGILPGDRIVSVNDSAIAGVKMPRDQIMKRLRGPKGTVVNLGVVRRNVPEVLQFKVVRDKIPLHSVDAAYMIRPKVGFIRISSFAVNTKLELIEALNKLTKQGMKSLILDLQENGGGYLEAAVGVASQFLEKDALLVYTDGRSVGHQDYKAETGGKFLKGDIVVLVDEYTASAAEIVSGAIQDHDRGYIVGRRTFGKGLVQRPIPLLDGSLIRVTVSHYYTPSGRCIQKPYEKGKSKEYQQDVLNRFKDGELMHRDSIHFADSLKYKTLKKGRTVYGGGGIMPDYFIPLDTLKYSKYYRNLSLKNCILESYMTYQDAHRKELKEKYADFEQFKKEYDVPMEIVDSIFSAGKRLNVTPANEEERIKAIGEVKMVVKGLTARDIWDMSEYYAIVNENNDAVNKALELLTTDKKKKK
ncbi:MAG: S41 family peptidase [Bacteroidaceae bacterium]|nr:S41 family peptidase [Bacteroidaceae bacterium]